MARLRVLTSRTLPQGAKAGMYRLHLVVRVLDGELAPGARFHGFDTHHPFLLEVKSVTSDATCTRVECEGSGTAPYEDLLEGAVIDTSGRTNGVHFCYEQ